MGVLTTARSAVAIAAGLVMAAGTLSVGSVAAADAPSTTASAKGDSVNTLSRRAGSVSDWSGDGFADVLGVDQNGVLYYYPNNGQKLTGKVKIGEGFGSYPHVRAGDFSGDGYADVIAIDSGHRLWYYPHNGSKLGARIRLGTSSNWVVDDLMVADWSGDGHADILVSQNSRLWYYPNNGNTISYGTMLSGGMNYYSKLAAADWSGDGHADLIGYSSGMQGDPVGALRYFPNNGGQLGNPQPFYYGDYKFIRAMDFSGDGFADFIGVAPDGKMWYYPHNGGVIDGPRLIGQGFHTFRHVL